MVHAPHPSWHALLHADTVLAAFNPTVPLTALSGWFGFQTKLEAATFLRARGAVVVKGGLQIKESRAAQQQQQQAAAREPT